MRNEYSVLNSYQRIKEIRELRNINQKDIADLLQTTQQQISKYEKGIQKMSFERYIVLAQFYNVSLDYFAGLIDTPKPLCNENDE